MHRNLPAAVEYRPVRPVHGPLLCGQTAYQQKTSTKERIVKDLLFLAGPLSHVRPQRVQNTHYITKYNGYLSNNYLWDEIWTNKSFNETRPSIKFIENFYEIIWKANVNSIIEFFLKFLKFFFEIFEIF